MLAINYARYQPAVFAGRDRARRMPSCMPFMCMTTAASIIIFRTDVYTSVSLIAVVLFLSLTLVLLGVLISLSCLTRQFDLVGLIKETGTSTTQGD
jgi:hypothetical protein